MITRWRSLLTPHRLESAIWTAFELSLLAIWTLYFAGSLLNFDPLMIPQGREYFVFIQDHFMWERARECGLCAMWNGSLRGGFPSFVDVHNSMLFPPVIIASYIWGALNGAKVVLVFTFFFAGFAQWWLGRVLGLGRIACVWSGGMAIVAGGLAGRMWNGGVPIIISAVCFALVLPPAIQLSRDGKRRSAAVLGLVLGLAIASGHGYFQTAFPMLAPLFLIFILGNPLGVRLLIKRYLLAGGIGVLVAAPFLVPLLHFFPRFTKWKDPPITEAQPFKYAPLNLVIDDINFYKAEALGTVAFPYWYFNYIGWIAVLLAVIGCYVLWRRNEARLAAFLVSWSVGAIWISSAQPLRWIRDTSSPGNPLYEFVVGIRHPSQIAGLAAPAILALAAIGVDGLIRRPPNWVHLELPLGSRVEKNRTWRLDLRWLLVIPLAFALTDLQQSSSRFLTLTRQPIEDMDPVFAAMSTHDSQWISLPWSEQFWLGQAFERNFKLVDTTLAWDWDGRPTLIPVLQLQRKDKGVPEGMTQVNSVNGTPIYAPPPGNEYAAVTHLDGTRTICSAQSAGGNIDVTCDLSQPGRLEIKENYYPGWKATLKGEPLDVSGSSGPRFSVSGDTMKVSESSGWISVDLPAGKSTVALRYRSWDVPLGVALMIVGLAIAGFCLVRREPAATRAGTTLSLVKSSETSESVVAD